MNKLLIGALFFSLLFNLGLIYFFMFKGETVQLQDGRTGIMMTTENKEFVLDEMRNFLESVQKINYGLLNDDPESVAEAGRKSGGSVIAHAPKGMMKSLPSNFKSLGFTTHDQFDQFAKTTKENFDKEDLHKKLNTLLTTCIACHKTFKIVEKEQ